MKVILNFRGFPHLEVEVKAESEEELMKAIGAVLKAVTELREKKP